MCNTIKSTEQEIRDVVDAFPAAPGFWASTFISLGWSASEARMYLETASRDASSPLRMEIDSKLGAELKVYAQDRNIQVGDMPVYEKHSDGRCVHRLRQVMTLEEQDAVLKEVSGYAKVTFSPSLRGTYVDHSVARAVRQVGGNWLRKMVPRGASCLEVGANIVGMVLACVDVETYHAYVPVLGARDGGRHSVATFLTNIGKGDKRGFTARQSEMARQVVESGENFMTWGRIEDDDRPGEYIISNHSDYDIDLDDVPAIMAKHKTRAWYGIMTRVKGLNSVESSSRGEIPVLGVRYVVDKAKDLIEFHFKGKSSFSYRHRFSSYVKREERNEYRWKGVYHDYVYTKLPVSTDSTLMYAIYRVGRGSGLFQESRYLSTGQRGMAKINSVKVYRKSGKWIIAPHSFVMERLAIDKVLEYRRSLGTRGNVVSTLAYMRSVRVRFYLNGVAVGVEHAISAETFESAAVFVELMMATYRVGGEMDYGNIMEAYRRTKSSTSFVDSVAFWLKGLVTQRFTGVKTTLRSWREAMEKTVLSWNDFSVGLQVCDEFVQIEEHCDTALVKNEIRGTGCPCRELQEVNAALAATSVYTSAEQVALRRYKEELLASLVDCECRRDDGVAMSASTSDIASVTGRSSTVVADDLDEEEEFFECGTSDVMVELNDSRADAVREYAGLMLFQEEATRVESLRLAAMVWSSGVPTGIELQRYRTPRCTPFLVKVEQGRLVEAVGLDSTTDVSAMVDMVNMKVVRTQRSIGRRKDVVGVPDGWHYSSTAMRVYNGKDLADAALELLSGRYASSGVAKLPLKFVQGAFGCGKTRRIVTEIAIRVAAGEKAAYLSATVASVDRVVADLRRVGIDGSQFCRTLDAYLLNRDEQYDVVYVDEAPMAHFGQMVACLAKMAVHEVFMFGDFKQIPFCSFTSDREYATPLADLTPWVRIISKMVELHRTPYDVLAAWNDVYGGALRACRCCEHVRSNHSSMELVRVRDVSLVPYVTSARYVTFTHADKEKLHKVLGFTLPVDVLKVRDEGGLSTVHEDQGGTHDQVILVRATAKYDPKESLEAPAIFNRLPYVLVATTRHKKKFSYYTVSVEDDVVCRRIAISKDAKQRKIVLAD